MMMTPSLVLAILVFLAISASADVSIDCGASEVYTDDEHSLTWRGDDDLFGKESLTAVVQMQSSSAAVSHVMSTLRVFPSRKKNCYSITDIEGQILVRASFFYGNYDKKSSPPSFDLHFDGNHWATVQTSIDQLVYYEVIYVPKNKTISVCLAQTQPNQFPFISALEVRNLESNMYDSVDAKYALFLNSRIAFGANSSIRSPDDTYDRIWVPARVTNQLISVTTDTPITANLPDNPPREVMQNAVTASSTSTIITLTPNLPDKEVPIYINWYFSELKELDTTQNRSFTVNIDGKTDSVPIIPPYGESKEFVTNDTTASSKTSFSLVSTSDSTLPPLINAMEVFLVSDPLTDGTNGKDVDGLVAFQYAYSVLTEWSGDPCLPSPYTWDWINCSNDATPRVTALDLSSFDLSGPLPDFSSMDALVTINLRNNSIYGLIPDFLGTLPNLKELNLADNLFNGPIPASITGNKKLKLVVSGNPTLCVDSGKSCQPIGTSPSAGDDTPYGSSRKKSNKLPVILGTTIPAFVIFWTIVGFILHHKRKTAAISAITTGQAAGGANRPNQASPGNVLMGKIGESMINEIKVNIQDETSTTDAGHESDPHAQ